MKAELRLTVLLSLLVPVLGCQSLSWDALGSVLGKAGSEDGLTVETMTEGLKEALAVGIQNAAAATSKQGGYSQNPDIRIGLPEELKAVGDTLKKIGLGGQVDVLERKMNEAAEQAAAGAAGVFMDAITRMTFDDAKAILYGGETGATDYLRKSALEPLRAKYEPIVEQHMRTLGVVELYENLLNRYEAVPLVPKIDFRVEGYVTEQALDGLFAVVAEEEKRIRQDPAARTTELLRKVFAGQ